MGEWQIGIRTDHSETADVIRRELGELLRDDESPPPGYSIVTTDGEVRGIGRPLGSLRLGQCVILRSRSRQRLTRALIEHVRAYAMPAPTTVRLRAAAVSDGRQVHLVPADRLWAAGTERRLEGAGLVPIDTPTVDLDGNASVVRPTVALLDTDGRAGAHVATWIIERRLLDGLDAAELSSRVAAAATLIDAGTTLEAQNALELVARLSSRIEAVDEDWSVADLVVG